LQKCRFVVTNTALTVTLYAVCMDTYAGKRSETYFFITVRDTLETYNPGLSYIHAVVATSLDKNQLISWNLFKYFIILPSETKNKQHLFPFETRVPACFFRPYTRIVASR